MSTARPEVESQSLAAPLDELALELPDEAPAASRAQLIADSEISPPPRAALRWWNVRPIFLILLLGALLRMMLISQPAIWGDEAATYSRVCSTYRDMLDVLQHDGFVPLHYEIYWLLARVFWMTPVVMRMIPMIAGICMIPAVYWLARQLAGQWVANASALFTACSAYMLVYSRDAKMYPHFWLCITLSVASYLWWLRSWRRVAWLAWIAASVAMVALHGIGMILLGLFPLMLFTARRTHWTQGLLTLVGLAIILAGPAGYYMKFNALVSRSEQYNDPNEATGTDWVAQYNRGRSGPEHVLYAATAFLESWEWPKAGGDSDINPDTVWWLKASAIVLLGAAAAGVFPWPRRWRAAVAEPQNDSLAGEAWWRRCLWLSCWLVIPVYGFYCKSVEGFAPPSSWIHDVSGLISGQWLALGIGAGLGGLALSILVDLGEIPGALAAMAIMLLGVNLLVIRTPLDPWARTWVNAAIVCAAFCFLGSGENLRRRVVHSIVLAAIVALIYFACQSIYASMSPQLSGSFWVPRYLGIVWMAFAITLICLISRLPSRGLRWAILAVLVIVNLQQFAHRVMLNINAEPDGRLLITGAEPPVDLIAADMVDSATQRRQIIGTRVVQYTPRSSTRFFISTPYGGPEPGMGNLDTFQGRYYVFIDDLDPMTPREFRRYSLDYARPDENVSPSHIASVARERGVDRIIVWDLADPQRTHPDAIQRRLGQDWSLISDQRFTQEVHWDWSLVHHWRRREYVRLGRQPA